MPKVGVHFKYPTKRLKNNVCTPLPLSSYLANYISSLSIPLSSPDTQILSQFSFFSASVHFSLNLASQASLIFLQSVITQTVCNKEKFKTYFLLPAGDTGRTHQILYYTHFSWFVSVPENMRSWPWKNSFIKAFPALIKWLHPGAAVAMAWLRFLLTLCSTVATVHAYFCQGSTGSESTPEANYPLRGRGTDFSPPSERKVKRKITYII